MVRKWLIWAHFTNRTVIKGTFRKPDSDYGKQYCLNHCPWTVIIIITVQYVSPWTVIIIITVQYASPWTAIMTTPEFCTKNFPGSYNYPLALAWTLKMSKFGTKWLKKMLFPPLHVQIRGWKLSLHSGLTADSYAGVHMLCDWFRSRHEVTRVWHKHQL